MIRLPKFLNSRLSVRLSLMVVVAIALLLIASMAVMLHYARKAVKEEAVQNASQTLEETVQHIDNILLSVEQTTDNFYINMKPLLRDSDMLLTCCRELVKSNPYVVGCAIAFKQNYFEGRERYMAYVHRAAPSGPEADSLVRSYIFGQRLYTEQPWFTLPMASAKPMWMNPALIAEQGTDPITTFSLPIPGPDGQPQGIIGVDVSLSLFSQIILSAKPSANSYATLLASDGTYIVHPDSSKLFHQTVFMQAEKQGADPSVREAAEAMTSGQTGYRPFRMDGTDYYVFYKPYECTAMAGWTLEKLKWSAGIIYPEDDIFGDYNRLLYYVIAIAVVGLLLLFLLCRTIIHWQLKPLQMLTEKAQHIAKGNFDESVPPSGQKDEIGRLQDNFRQMQQSLSAYIDELHQLTDTLQQRSEELRVAFDDARKADRMKMSFLRNMTNQMVAPADAIEKDVEALCTSKQGSDISLIADDIQQKGNAIAELLNNLISTSDDELKAGGPGKEEKGGRT